MRLIPKAHLDRHSPAWREAITPAIVEQTPTGVRVDTTHPAWLAVHPPQPKPERPAPPAPKPITKREWPLALRALAWLATPEDAGMGDVLHRVLAWVQADKLAEHAPGMAAVAGGMLVRMLAGKSFDEVAIGLGAGGCGCPDKQRWLNQRFPLHELSAPAPPVPSG